MIGNKERILNKDLLIIAIGNKNEKGRALEQQFGYVLNHLGYKDLTFNINRTGEELDVKGYNKLFNDPLIAECKAHKKKISPGTIRKFFATFQKDLDKNPKMRGIIISLSGYTSNALEWYSGLTTEKKKVFKLLEGKDFITFLNKVNLLCSINKIKSSISLITSLPIKEKKILITDRGIFWKITVYAENSDSSYVIFLNSIGETPYRTDIDYILKREKINEEKILRINDRHQIISCLYDLNEKSTSDISQVVQEPEEDVKIIIDELFAERIITISENKIKLLVEFHSFYLIYKECNSQSKNELIKLMLSPYYERVIDDAIDIIGAKFKLKLDNHKQELIQILKISPKCLEFCLEGDTTPYKNAYNQMIKDKTVSEDFKERFNQKQIKIFLQKLISLVFNDCVNEVITKDLIIKEDINIIYSKIDMKFGSEEDLKLNLITKIPIMLLKLAPGKSIKEGQWVSAQDIETYINIGNRFSAINEYDEALDSYNYVIENASNSILIVKAKLNKAFTLNRKEDSNNAYKVLNELEHSEDFEIIINDENLHNMFRRNMELAKSKIDSKNE